MTRFQISRKKPAWAFAAFLGVLLGGLAASADDFVPGKVEVLESSNGSKLIIVHAKPIDKNQALIKFENTGTDLDGRVFLHDVKETGRDKYDYTTGIDGAPWNTLYVRKGSYEVWIKGIKEPVTMKFDKADTEKVKAQEIVDQYEKAEKAPKN